MEHLILNEETGETLAAFSVEQGRDMCLDTFESTYPDCKFTVNNESEV